MPSFRVVIESRKSVACFAVVGLKCWSNKNSNNKSNNKSNNNSNNKSDNNKKYSSLKERLKETIWKI